MDDQNDLPYAPGDMVSRVPMRAIGILIVSFCAMSTASVILFVASLLG